MKKDNYSTAVVQRQKQTQLYGKAKLNCPDPMDMRHHPTLQLHAQYRHISSPHKNDRIGLPSP